MIERAKLGKGVTGIRYSDEVFALSSQICRTSPKAYELLRSVIRLPTQRRLKSHYTLPPPRNGGIRSEDVVLLKEKLNALPPEEQPSDGFHRVALSFDACTIKKGVIYNSNTFEIIGFADEEVVDFKTVLNGYSSSYLNSSDLASKCTVVMASTINGTHIKYPLGVWCTSSLTSSMNKQMIHDAIRKLMSQKIICISLCADGASENRSMFEDVCTLTIADVKVLMTSKQMAPPILGQFVNNDLLIAMKHPYFDCLIFCLSDPPHLVKKLKNAFEKSGDKEKYDYMTRRFQMGGKFADFTDVKTAYRADKANNLKDYKANDISINPNSWSRMKVAYAVHTYEPSFVNMVQRYFEQEDDDGASKSFLIEYMNQVGTLWDTLNFNDPIDAGDDVFWKQLGASLDYFYSWLNDCTTPGDGLTQPKHEKDMTAQFLTRECWHDMQQTCSGLALLIAFYFPNGCSDEQKARLRRFSQDCLEQLFGIIRNHLGTNHTAMDPQAVKNSIQHQRHSTSAITTSSARGGVSTGNSEVAVSDGAVVQGKRKARVEEQERRSEENKRARAAKKTT